MDTKNKILIIGGGISGLFMAYVLQRHDYDCLILERDESIDSRKQGYSLTMQNQTKKIFEEYGLLDEIYHLGSDTDRKIFYDSTGHILHHSKMSGFNYPLPRQKLRQLFYQKLKSGTVIWSKTVDNVIEGATIQIKCTDSSIYECDVLIACDGINSRIRKLIASHVKLQNFDLVNIYGMFDLRNLSLDAKKFFDKATIQVLDGYHRLFSKPFDEHHQMWELTFPTDHTSTDLTPAEAHTYVENLFNNWNLLYVREAVRNTHLENIIVHPLSDYVPLRSDLEKIPKNIIFVGDAIHPMAPFIGMGANEAFNDCYVLIKLFLENQNLDRITELYYQDVVDRTSKTVTESRNHVKFYHTTDAVDIDKLTEFKKWNQK